MWVSLRNIGDSSARLPRSTYDSSVPSIITVAGHQISQVVWLRAGAAFIGMVMCVVRNERAREDQIVRLHYRARRSGRGGHAHASSPIIARAVTRAINVRPSARHARITDVNARLVPPSMKVITTMSQAGRCVY